MRAWLRKQIFIKDNKLMMGMIIERGEDIIDDDGGGGGGSIN